MRGLVNAILVLCLLVGMIGGSIAHAGEAGGAHDEMTSATAWLHVAGDADEVPADADKNFPHHHNICHGHDLATPAKACGAPRALLAVETPRPTAHDLSAPAPIGALLRPPIT